ncbi:MAG: hypothetical protein HOE53_04175 [Candidatus Magasanikbacteria bacterium]|jgi:hypothetical protein|nr:hypothetical protein [Candidatus Magasanikbacteria bacterium]
MYIEPRNHWKAITVATLLVALALWGIMQAVNPSTPADSEITAEPLAPPLEISMEQIPPEGTNSRAIATPEEKVAAVAAFLPMDETIWETEFIMTEEVAAIALVVDRDSLEKWHAPYREVSEAEVDEALWVAVPKVNLRFPESIERKRYQNEDGSIKMLQIPEYQIVMIWITRL